MTGSAAARSAVGVAGALVGVAAYHAMATTATGSGAFFVALGTGTIAYAAVVIALCYRTSAAPIVIAVALILAVVARVPLLTADIGDQSDIYRYLWDARVVRAGLNPYAVTPQSAAVAWLHTADTRRMNNQDVPSPYPPAAQLFFAVVALFVDSAPGVRWVLAVCDVGVMAALAVWLRSTRRSPAWVLAYAWHPLVIIETAREGHLDVAGVLIVLIAAIAAARAAMGTATVLLAVATAFKLWPVVLAPLLWARGRGRHAAVATLVLAGFYLPFVWDGSPPLGSVVDVVRRFRFNSPVFDLLEQVAPAWPLTALAVGAGLVTACLQRHRSLGDPGAWAWPLAVTLLLSPMVYPWYLVWLVPFLGTRATLPLAVWSLSICSTYVVWAAARGGAAWRVPGWALVLEYGAFAVAAVWTATRRDPPGRPS